MKEYNQKIKSQQLAQELQNAVEGSEFRSKHLEQFVFKQGQDAEELLDRMTDSKRFEEIKSHIDNIDAEYESQRLIKALTTLKRLRSKRRRLYMLTTGIAAVLVLAFFFTIRINEHKPSQAVNDLELAVNTPILISGGKTIKLEAQSNELITEDSLMITRENNTLLYTDTTRKNITNELILPAKCIYTVKLSDGSVVTVNAGSRLSYPSSFDGDTRKIHLTGEAYFKVAKSDKPFIVYVDNLEVKVYGTEFNINSFRPNKIETILVKGSVGISSGNKKEIIMNPNQLAVYNCSTSRIKVDNVNASAHIQWMNDCFNYEQTSLSDILSDIAKWYGVDFNINKSMDDIMLTFYSPRDNDIEKIIPLIESIADIKITKKGNKIYYVDRAKQ